MRSVTNSALGLLLALRVILRPKGGIYALIKFGNVISGMEAYKVAVQEIKLEEDAKNLIEERFSKGFNNIEDFSHYASGTLGEVYYSKMKKYNLVCYPIKIQKTYTEVEYIRERRREIHDLLHVVLEYNTTLSGEASLNSFLVGKSKMPTCIFIVVGIIMRTLFKNPKDLKSLVDKVVNAYIRGKNAKSPFSIRWEEYLNRPIEEVRLAFGV